MTGKGETTQPNCNIAIHHALYKVDKHKLHEETKNSEYNEDLEIAGLETVFCTLSTKQEHLLRVFLARRLKKGAIYVGTGTFSGMEFSIGGGSPAVCYYVLLPSQVIICLLTKAEANLEVFRPELARFCEELETHLQEPTVGDHLSKWYAKCVQYVNNIIEALGPQVAALLQLVQQNGEVKVKCSEQSTLAADLEQFLTACSVAECLVGAPPGPDAVLREESGSAKLSLDGVEPNAYCTEWAKLLLELGSGAEPWRLRKLLEAFKLKTIKDMNILKRLLKQAETDHYFLYRAYSFLWHSGNSDVLLRQAALEGSSPEVLSVLEGHLNSLGAAASVAS